MEDISSKDLQDSVLIVAAAMAENPQETDNIIRDSGQEPDPDFEKRMLQFIAAQAMDSRGFDASVDKHFENVENFGAGLLAALKGAAGKIAGAFAGRKRKEGEGFIKRVANKVKAGVQKWKQKRADRKAEKEREKSAQKRSTMDDEQDWEELDEVTITPSSSGKAPRTYEQEEKLNKYLKIGAAVLGIMFLGAIAWGVRQGAEA